MGFERERRRWRVRLRDDLGRILGAGTMLDEQHLLTCAHVVENGGGPRTRVAVDFVGLPDAPSGTAHVVDGGWIPPADDERGDIALLRLDRPQRSVFGAPLHRMPLGDHQLVRAYGFPHGADSGMWTLARLVGEGGPGSEWVQLHRTVEAEPIGQGYSGTAVLDDATGYVVGMVVGRYTGDGGRVAWMIPVETMLGHLPRLNEWATGSPAVDESFVRPDTDTPPDTHFVQQLTGWFASTQSGAVWVVVTGDAGSAMAKGLRLGVALADRERSLGLGELPDVGKLPRAGSVDLAVDAAGKTADDVRRRIDERLNLAAAGSAPGRTVVVDAIDDAAEPERLVEEVLAPMAGRAGELGIRMVLAFRREDSPGVTVVRESSSPGVPRPAEDDLEGRLDMLTKIVDELAAIEEYQVTVATRFTGVAMVPARAKRLRGALNQLRSAETDGDSEWVQRHIGSCERSIAPAIDDGRRVRAVLDGLLARRDELRARLDAYAEMARNHDLVEEPVLDKAYGPAWKLLFEGPCELEAAVAAVDDYATAVRGRIEGRG